MAFWYFSRRFTIPSVLSLCYWSSYNHKWCDNSSFFCSLHTFFVNKFFLTIKYEHIFTSPKELMFSPEFHCLLVSNLTHKVIGDYWWNIKELCAIGPGTNNKKLGVIIFINIYWTNNGISVNQAAKEIFEIDLKMEWGLCCFSGGLESWFSSFTMHVCLAARVTYISPGDWCTN